MTIRSKIIKKLASLALALVLTAQPLASFPMNAFAGTGSTDMMTQATFDLEKIIELGSGETFVLANHVKNIQPKDEKVSFEVESQTAFSGQGNVLDEDGTVQNPGTAKVKVTATLTAKYTHIIANINGMLGAANAAANAAAIDAAAWVDADAWVDAAANAANIAHYAAQSDEFFDAYVGYGAAYSLDYAVDSAGTLDSEIGDYAAAAAADTAAIDADGGKNSAKEGAPFPDYAASWVANVATANAWANSYNNSVGGIIDKLKEAYAEDKTEVQKKWLVAAYGMAKVAAHVAAQRFSGKGLDLEAKLKVVYACYRVAEAVYRYNSDGHEDKAVEYKAKADVLQEVIDACYDDKVGDIEK